VDQKVVEPHDILTQLPIKITKGFFSMKQITYFLAGLVLVALAFVMFTRSGGLDTDRDQAIEMYGGPPSQFLEIDGSLLHFRDEGEGRPLVLLHGSRASLHQWDGWVNELKDEFRIIRVDGAAHGLSGLEKSGDFSPERQNLLLKQLLEHLEIKSFYLGGTSSGATQAVRFAAEYPAGIEKLILSTVPLKLPASSDLAAYRTFIFWLHNDVLGSNATNLYWRLFLEGIFADPGKVTDEMVIRYRTLNGLPDLHREQQLRIQEWYKWGGPERDFQLAGMVTAPVFVQWGVAGPVLPKEIQCEITTAFKNTEVRVISYADLGHKLVMEDPVRTARDAARYINGEDIGGNCDEN
jgi:pimeloyl-ACP methyl ester carboxylesterase